MKRLRGIWPDLGAVLLLIALPMLVFWRVWTPSGDDRVMFGGDILMGAFPTRVFVHRLLALGEQPIWNPYQLGGMPLAGDIQVATYYLPNVLLDQVFRGREISYVGFELLVVAHYMLGAIGMYAYLRGLRLRAGAALLGAVVFQFNGFFVGHRGHYNMMAVAAWLPAVLALLDRAYAARRPAGGLAWAAAAGLALSQLVMAGHPQAALYCGTLVAAYSLWRWLSAPRPAALAGRARLWAWARVPTLGGLAAVIAVGVAAVALLPMAELLGRSLRSEPTYEFAAQYSLLPRNLVGLLMPDLLGWSGTEFRIYAGIITLVLAAVALVVPASGRPERRFFAVASVVALAVALGGFTLLEGVIYRFVPGFGSVRVSARAFYIANLSLAALAAFGAEALLRDIATVELRRLRGLLRVLWGLVAAVAAGGVVLYILLAQNYKPVGEDFFFSENLFQPRPAQDTFGLLTQISNQYLLFGLLLTASTALLALRAGGRVTTRTLAIAAIVLGAVDVGTFAPVHDTIKADPEKVSFAVRNYASIPLRQWWEQQDQRELVERVSQLPDGLRVDNAGEVLPDNYSQIWPASFSTGYNVLDIKERFELLTRWPNLPPALRRDLLSVGYVMTVPDKEGKADPPEDGAKLVVKNSQGLLWRRAQQPEYARFSTAFRPVDPSLAVNALLQLPDEPLGARPTLDGDGKKLGELLADRWPDIGAEGRYSIGTTGAKSPVDLTVLSGGPIKYSAVVVGGKTVTPEQRGIVLALVDPASGKVLAADGFDTYQLASEADRLAATIEAAPQGTIVALATYDEGMAKVNDRVRAALASAGAADPLRDAVGKSYGLLGVKGAAPGSALERLADTAFTLDVGLGAGAAPGAATFSYAVVTYRPDRITLAAENSAYGLLSVSETVYPGWEAYVDGVRTPIMRANGMQRAVVLPPAPPGKPHEVTFVYRPASLRTGTTVSLATLGLTFGLLAALGALSLQWRPAPALGRRLPA